MQQKSLEIEQIALRRAHVADADKVRYRVYSSPTEFIAVIAENALMAVKVANIKTPHKIVRDIPTANITIEAQKMAKVAAAPERVAMSTARVDVSKQRLIAELAPRKDNEKHADFKPLTLGQLQRAALNRPRILSPALLSEIIEEHSKAHTEPVPDAESLSAPPAAPPVAETPTPAVAELAPVSPLEPVISTEEKLLQMAAETLPSASDLPKPAEKTLSPEEVKNLLNE